MNKNVSATDEKRAKVQIPFVYSLFLSVIDIYIYIYMYIVSYQIHYKTEKKEEEEKKEYKLQFRYAADGTI